MNWLSVKSISFVSRSVIIYKPIEMFTVTIGVARVYKEKHLRDMGNIRLSPTI